MPDPLIVTEYDVKDSNLLLRYLRRVGERVLTLDDRIGKVERQPTGVSVPEIRDALKATGRYPLPVDNLLGVLAQPQMGKAAVYTTEPTGQILQSLYDAQLVVVGTTATGDKLYRVIGGNPNTLRAINPAISGTTVAVPDNTFTIYDDVDNTKVIKFEASTIATGSTRTMTVPDVDQILAGRNVNNQFSTNQTILSTQDATIRLIVQNTNATGVSAAGRIEANGDTASLALFGHGTGRTFSVAGVVMGGWTELRSVTGNGLMIGSQNAVPIVFETTNLERLRIDSAGLATFTSTGLKSILVKPSAAPAASTIMTEVQTSTGGSVWSVDAEGDQINKSLILVGTAVDTLSIQPASASGGSNLFTIKTSTGKVGVAARDDGYIALGGASAGIHVTSTGAVGGALAHEITWGGVQTSGLTYDGDFQCDLNVQTGLTVQAGTSITSGTSITAGTSIQAGTSVTATSTSGFRFPSGVFWRSGSGSPEGVVSGNVGSLWSRTDGAGVTTLYVKEFGTGSTGWTPK